MQKLSEMIDYCEKNKDKRFNALNVLFQVGDAVMDCHTADVVEVRHGEWTKPSTFSDTCCSRCKRPTKMLFGILPLYCPMCGAKMDGEGK